MGDYGVLWVTSLRRGTPSRRDHGTARFTTAIHAGPGILIAALTAASRFSLRLVAISSRGRTRLDRRLRYALLCRRVSDVAPRGGSSSSNAG